MRNVREQRSDRWPPDKLTGQLREPHMIHTALFRDRVDLRMSDTTRSLAQNDYYVYTGQAAYCCRV